MPPISKNTPTIATTIKAYLYTVQMARSENTARTYHNALELFLSTLKNNNLPPEEKNINTIKEDSINWLIAILKHYSPSTERLYLTAVYGYFEYLAAENLVPINLSRIRSLIRQRARKPGQRLPQFPRKQIDKIIEYTKYLTNMPVNNEIERLRNLRDRAFLITLADTGLRVHEACALRRGDIDWNEGKAIVTGKGNRQAVIRFSSRSNAALRDYLNARARLDGAFGKPLSTLPLFARHDKGAGKKVLSITTTTGRNIVAQRVAEALGNDSVGTITPHSFRHYFVTAILRGSGGNLKLAQELARHRNISVTQRYAHLSDDEIDREYLEIFG
jgi:site-specific recombinase XerD